MNIDLSKHDIFQAMTAEEIDLVLTCSKAYTKQYQKQDVVFSQIDPPLSLYVLLEGTVAVCKDTMDGKRYLVNKIDEQQVFGEVFLFLNQVEYSYYAVCLTDCLILEIPKDFLTQSCMGNCQAHAKIMRNLLSILAGKAYFLNQKVLLLSSGSLRGKIVRYLFELDHGQKYIHLPLKREQLAAYLNVTRPSLSRELGLMCKEELISLNLDVVQILDREAMANCL